MSVIPLMGVKIETEAGPKMVTFPVLNCQPPASPTAAAEAAADAPADTACSDLMTSHSSADTNATTSLDTKMQAIRQIQETLSNRASLAETLCPINRATAPSRAPHDDTVDDKSFLRPLTSRDPSDTAVTTMYADTLRHVMSQANSSGNLTTGFGERGLLMVHGQDHRDVTARNQPQPPAVDAHASSLPIDAAAACDVPHSSADDGSSLTLDWTRLGEIQRQQNEQISMLRQAECERRAEVAHARDDAIECNICGDKATGLHYGVHSCEG